MIARIDARAAMMRLGALAAVGASLPSAGCASAVANHAEANDAASTASPPHAPPDLVVAIVVDQFAAWIADTRVPEFPPDGGFARLRREGTWTHRVEHPYAGTDTAPGHAMIFTGRAPRESGIYANETLDARGDRVSILRDAQTHLVDASGPLDDIGSSIAMLRVPTIADDLRERRPDAVVVSVSLKDRGAIFGGGRHPDATIWFDAGGDRLATSTYFATNLPAWAIPLATPDAMRARRATPWEPFDPAWVAAHAATPDAQRGEGDLDGWGTTFPHDFAHARRPGSALRASPRGDELVLAVATAAVEHARHPRAPMFLAVSLSSHDYVNHLFGPDSWEAWDQLRRLDASLGRFFADLDRLVGADHWAVVLTADHGGITLPEAAASSPASRPWCVASRSPGRDPYERPCGEMTRLIDDVITDDLRATSIDAIGPGQWVLGVADPYVFLTPEAAAVTGARRDQLLGALRTRLEHTRGVRAVYDTNALPRECPPDDVDSLDALACRAIPPHVGTFYLLTEPGAFFDANYTIGFGTSHGSPYRYDRTIPMFVRAPGHVDANRSVDTPVDSRVVHDTLAWLLGMSARP
jgi:arylsulfatase A-like enzyme